jgi:hypothetical protein
VTHPPAKITVGYRDRAADCERVAATAIDPSNRVVMLELTARWRSIANESDAQKNAPSADSTAPPRITGARAMTESADLRAEAQRLRTFALTVTDLEVLAGIRTMIEEL